MHVFVLTTGRSGSTTFARACTHMTNFTVGHESHWQLVGESRLDYIDQNIEVDNRLAWLLGRLDDRFGNNAYYVHLLRDRQSVARSYCQRRLGDKSIIRAYSHGILYRSKTTHADCRDYYDTVNANIRLFLKDKTHKMSFDLAQANKLFPKFWHDIGAAGDLSTAMAEWSIAHNALDRELTHKNSASLAYEKIKRIARRLPDFLKNA